MNNPNPTFIQWNSRSLYKSKLEEFRYNLRKSDPLFVLLSETHWKNKYNISFKAYVCIKKNRIDKQKGGVAILLKKHITYNILPLPVFTSLEVVGITCIIDKKKLDLISVYSPRGDCDFDEINALFSSPQNDFIIGGDFNGHHYLWDKESPINRCGRSIFEFINNNDNVILSTPANLPTRFCPISGRHSTLDLTFVSCNLAPKIKITTGPDWGSDHLPIMGDLSIYQNLNPSRPFSWKFREDSWVSWNREIEQELDRQNFNELAENNSIETYSMFSSVILNASNKYFSKSSNKTVSKEPQRPWWTLACQKAVAEYRRARTIWLNSPCSNNKTNLNRKSAIKKKIICQAKKKSWNSHLDSLCIRTNPKKVWSFCKSMLGANENNIFKTCNILDSSGNLIVDPAEKKTIYFSTFTAQLSRTTHRLT